AISGSSGPTRRRNVQPSVSTKARASVSTSLKGLASSFRCDAPPSPIGSPVSRNSVRRTRRPRVMGDDPRGGGGRHLGVGGEGGGQPARPVRTAAGAVRRGRDPAPAG